MTARDVANSRLVNQQIAGARCTTPGGVVAALGAMQAQDYRAALWAIGLRSPAATEAGVERAIADRVIVRTWLLRGTLHFAAAADVRWMLALLAPRIIAGSARRRRELDLSDDVYARSRDLFVEALRGGKRLPRDQMTGLLERAGISTAGQRGYHILHRLAQDGLLCLGPHQGKQQTFVLLDDWVPGARRLERAEALTELARRYFTGHGPATLPDFVWWSGLNVADARAGLQMAAPLLAQVTIDGDDHWMPQDASTLNDGAAAVHLLPGYDEYLLGYRDRSAVLDPQHAGKLAPGGNGVFRPMIVADGRVVGTWKRSLKRGTVLLKTSRFVSLVQAQDDATRAAAAGYAAFLGLRLR